MLLLRLACTRFIRAVPIPNQCSGFCPQSSGVCYPKGQWSERQPFCSSNVSTDLKRVQIVTHHHSSQRWIYIYIYYIYIYILFLKFSCGIAGSIATTIQPGDQILAGNRGWAFGSFIEAEMGGTTNDQWQEKAKLLPYHQNHIK